MTGEEDASWTDVGGGDSDVEYIYTSICAGDNFAVEDIYCGDGEVIFNNPNCDQADALPPRWSRVRDPATGEWGLWQRETLWTCPGDDDSITVTAADFARLPLSPSPLSIQPPNGWTLAGLPTIAYSSSASQGFTVAILGRQVQVLATPASYSWDFGDGTVFETTDPGKPWPEQTITHTYTAAGAATPALTTTWAGRFRVEGTSRWVDVAGTAVTQSAAEPLTVHTARTRLVEDPLG